MRKKNLVHSAVLEMSSSHATLHSVYVLYIFSVCTVLNITFVIIMIRHLKAWNITGQYLLLVIIIHIKLSWFAIEITNVL